MFDTMRLAGKLKTLAREEKEWLKNEVLTFAVQRYNEIAQQAAGGDVKAQRRLRAIEIAIELVRGLKT
jgi:hypothetical protein